MIFEKKVVGRLVSINFENTCICLNVNILTQKVSYYTNIIKIFLQLIKTVFQRSRIKYTSHKHTTAIYYFERRGRALQFHLNWHSPAQPGTT